jgi:hypothetical protein
LPIDNSFGLAFPIVQYIDDTLIIMLEEARQLFTFECLLHTFAVSTGLKVNFNKCYIVPLKVVEQKVNILVGTLGCGGILDIHISWSTIGHYKACHTRISASTIQD